MSNQVINASELVRDDMIIYNNKVIKERAIPSLVDGLKIVQRRILYGSFKNGYKSSGKFIKSARIVGDVMGILHPHGDTSVYDTMCLMNQTHTNHLMLLSKHGGFTNILGEPSSAMRYTECKLSKVSEDLLLNGIDGVVDMIPTYDGDDLEPVYLPAKIPMVLINGYISIGAGGFASSIPSHSLDSVIDSTIQLIKDPETTVERLVNEFNFKPSFPYGGLVDTTNLVDIYSGNTGLNNRSITTRAVFIEDTESDKNYDILTVNELPYGVTINTVVDQIKSFYNNSDSKKRHSFFGLSEFEDLSSGDNPLLKFKYIKGTNLEFAKRELYKKTSLQSFVTFNPNLINAEEKLVEYTSIKDIINDWLDVRRKIVKRDKTNNIRKLEYRIYILKAVIEVLCDQKNLDKFLKIVQDSKSKEEMYKFIKETFKNLIDIQIDYLVNVRLYNINKLESSKYIEELKEKEAKVQSELIYLKNPDALNEFIIEELEDIKAKKYSNEPFYETKYFKLSEEKELNEEDLTVERHTLILTKKGLLKNFLYTDRTQGRNGKGISVGRLSEGDSVLSMTHVNSNEYVLFMTDDGYTFKYMVNSLPLSGNISRIGTNISNLVNGKKIVSMITMNKETYNSNNNLLIVTKSGSIKLIDFNEITNSKRNGLIITKLREDDHISSVFVVDKDPKASDKVLITREDNKYFLFRLSDIPLLGRSTYGVTVFPKDPNNNHLITSSSLVDSNSSLVLVVNDEAKGKMVKIHELVLTNRPSSGKLIQKEFGSSKNIYSKVLTDEDLNSSLTLLSDKGTITIPLNSIPVYKKSALGTSLKKLDKTEKIIDCSVDLN